MGSFPGHLFLLINIPKKKKRGWRGMEGKKKWIIKVWKHERVNECSLHHYCPSCTGTSIFFPHFMVTILWLFSFDKRGNWILARLNLFRAIQIEGTRNQFQVFLALQLAFPLLPAINCCQPTSNVRLGKSEGSISLTVPSRHCKGQQSLSSTHQPERRERPPSSPPSCSRGTTLPSA